MSIYDDVLMEQAANNNNKPSTSSSPLITTEKDLTNANGEQTYIPTYKPVYVKPITPREKEQQMLNNLSAQMKSISAETDETKKANALLALKGEAAATFASIAGQTRKLAEVQAGIPLLAEQVRRAEMLDKSDPEYSRHLADSRETALLRQRLMGAQGRADVIARQLFTENPGVASLSTQVDSFVKLHDVLQQKDMLRKDQQEQKVQDFMSVISPEMRKDVWSIRPDLKGNDQATAQFLTQELKMNRKDWEPILSGAVKPEELILHGLSGNKVAAAMAVKKQAEATGLPEDQLVKQARLMHDFVNNPTVAEKMMQDFGLVGSPKELKSYKMLGMKGDKQGQTDQLKARLGMVDTLAAKLAIGNINNNIDKWPVAPGNLGIMNVPEAGPIFNDFQKTAGRKPSVQEFYNAYVNAKDITPEERTSRSEIVKGSYAEVLKQASAGIYGTNIDVVGLTNKLMIRGATSVVPDIRSWR